MTKFCPNCYLTEADLDKCNNSDFGIPCPNLQEADPSKQVTLRCGPCDFTRTVPIKDLLSGRAKNELKSCQRDECACVVISQGTVPEVIAAAVEAVQPIQTSPDQATAEKSAKVYRNRKKDPS